MRTKSGRASTIGAVRRQQIVRAAIEVLARDGMPQASFQRIAKAAELSSPGMISYHFTDKHDLMLSVVADVIGRFDAQIRESVAAVEAGGTAAPAQLAAYLAGAIRFHDQHRDDVRAVWQVIRNVATDPSQPGPAVIDKEAQLSPLRDLLDAGVAAGVFRPVNTAWVASCVYGSVTGFIDLADQDPEIDAEAYLAELQRLYAGALANPEGSFCRNPSAEGTNRPNCSPNT